MLKHYIKFALRNFRSNKIIFGGSLTTICLGALSVSLLFLYIQNEITRDDFHKQEENIYLTVVKSSPESQWENARPTIFFNFDYRDYPEIHSATAVQKYNEGELSISYNQTTQYPEGLVVDSTFFQIFDFSLKTGDEQKVLLDPDALMITEDLATKLFGNEDPIGKRVTVSGYMQDDYLVKGILEKAPANSSLTFDFILPNSYVPNQYFNAGIEFLLMHPEADVASFTRKIEHLGDSHQQFKGSTLGLVPFESVYFNEEHVDFRDIFSAYGNKSTLYILIIIMLVILVISAMNISNLQIINTNTSVKYIVLSVINGAQKRHILYQKITELTLLILISVVIISVVQLVALPVFNNFIQIPLSPSIGYLTVINIFIVTLFAGLALIYPVIVAMNIPIIHSLKNQAFFTSKLVGKKSALTLQYALTLTLLISSIVIVKQLDMMLDKDLGFNSKNIIQTQLFHEIPTPAELFIPKDDTPENMKAMQESVEKVEAKRKKQEREFEFVKNELIASAAIANFTQGNSPLFDYKTPWKVIDNSSEYIMQNTLVASSMYDDIFGFRVLEGRFFDPERDQGNSKKAVINEAAKKYYGIENIRDNRILNKYWNREPNDSYEIIGVVRDFNYQRLSMKPKPLVMVSFGSRIQEDFLIQFEKGATSQGLRVVENLFHEVNPNESFKYTFLSDKIAKMYEKERQLSIMYIIFTGLALLISSIGLFTIALYDTRRRVKEIGIRKVNGAKTRQILTMLNKDFAKYVLIAFVFAGPVTYLLMHKWLENFAYRTELSWWIFAVAGVSTLVIALLTVSWQSYRAAVANPANALRDE